MMISMDEDWTAMRAGQLFNGRHRSNRHSEKSVAI